MPYIQPGSAGALAEGGDTLLVAWQTECKPAEFAVDYGPSPAYGNSAVVTRGIRTVDGGKDYLESTPDERAARTPIVGRYNYSASLIGLKLARKRYYRVRIGNHTIAEG